MLQKQKDIDNYQVMFDSLYKIDGDYGCLNDKFQEIQFLFFVNLFLLLKLQFTRSFLKEICFNGVIRIFLGNDMKHILFLVDGIDFD